MTDRLAGWLQRRAPWVFAATALIALLTGFLGASLAQRLRPNGVQQSLAEPPKISPRGGDGRQWLERVAGWVHGHARLILGAAIVLALVAGLFGLSVAKRLSPYGTEDPATQSVQARKRFEHLTARQLEPGVVALIRSPAGASVRSPITKDIVNVAAVELRAQPQVVTVLTYYETNNSAMVSRDGRATYVLAYFKPLSDKKLEQVAQQIEHRFAGQSNITLGGIAIANAQIDTQVSHDITDAELLAFPFIALLLLLFFRSLVAALLPPLLGGLTIVCTFFALRLVGSVVDLSVFALNLTTGIGLGLAIDYSLFMVSRYREEAAEVGFGRRALERTLMSAGRTILFSSLTVAAALVSLVVFPQRYLYSMGIAGALVALIAAALALLVLPALLSVLGRRVNALAPKPLARAAEREARQTESGFWYRLSKVVMRRPLRVAVLSATVLIALGIPFTGIKFISVNAGVLPSSDSARTVNDALVGEFPPNRTSPLEVVVGRPSGAPEVSALAARLRQLPDVATVEAPLSAGGQSSLLNVAPAQPAFSDATKRLVSEIRAIHEPFYVGVAGQTASFVDLLHSLGSHLPVVMAIVLATTLIALFLMTGSVVLPIKAVLMNVLSLSATFGILVLIFQDGNLQGLLSFHSFGALDSTQPILLFAIGFGLATDYGVFLLSRIKEARDAGVTDSTAVAMGLERTGRIVTAAALLFAVAVGSGVTSSMIFIKELGLGAALVVLIDASVVRALLVPSLMALLGSLNWWAPGPLRRLHDSLGLGVETAALIAPPHAPPGRVKRLREGVRNLTPGRVERSS